jgi:hypothetical protein|uniref:Uncharacterized protein n=1 Tax=viral metagenome TaxID=1070528 RepID=A0A6C0B8A0_9ZZZZ
MNFSHLYSPSFYDLCSPAFLYCIISIFYLIINNSTKFDIKYIIIKLFFILLWSVFLNILCSIGYEMIAWVLIIFPFFIQKVTNIDMY